MVRINKTYDPITEQLTVWEIREEKGLRIIKQDGKIVSSRPLQKGGCMAEEVIAKAGQQC